MPPQKLNPSLHVLLLSSWRHDQEHARGTHYPSLPPRVLCLSNDPASLTIRQDNRSKIRQQLLENCEQYVLNYIPTHLLRISDMALVTRVEFWEAERPRVESELQEYDFQQLAEPKRGSGPGNPSRNNWHLRTRSDEIMDINRDVVRYRPRHFRRVSYFIFKYIRNLFKFAIFSPLGR